MSDRFSDWDARLAVYLAASLDSVRAGEPNLCALFACGAVEALTGANPAVAYRGRYSEVATRLEAEFDSLFPVRPTALAQRGDLAWCDGSVGVVIGGDAMFVGEFPEGTPDLVRVARAQWVKVWGVGHG